MAEQPNYQAVPTDRAVGQVGRSEVALVSAFTLVRLAEAARACYNRKCANRDRVR